MSTPQEANTEPYGRGEIDDLTGLPNRHCFTRTMEQTLHAARAHGQGYVILVDIDDFRKINQGFGYDAGDSFIMGFATFLQGEFGRSHVTYRMNSDSFLLVSTAGSHPEPSLQATMEAILERCRSPWVVGDRVLYCTASVAAVNSPKSQQSVDRICRNLDSALCRAKESGKNRFVIYREDMGDVAGTVAKHHEIAGMLWDAVKEDFAGFQLYYQPIYSAAAETIIGAEALLRYTSKDGILLPPGSFIALAEKNSLICPSASMWSAQPPPSARVCYKPDIPIFV